LNDDARPAAAPPRPDAPAEPAGLPPVLDRRFDLLAFDWDGTAVADRREDASRVRALIEALLRREAVVAVITGTSLANIERQLAGDMVGAHKRRLYILTNRGSEVFGHDDASRSVLLWRRTATPREDRLLTQVAEAVRDELARRTGLEIGIVYDRLNRRKVDLIPVPEWRDPPKSAIGELRRAVEARLGRAGLRGGIREAVDLAHRAAEEAGLKDARITSDVKHIEIGLTDKGDAVRWIMRHLAPARGIGPRQTLIAGDEFGPIGGLPGSDSLMIVPEAAGATFVSVGPEPEGVPAGVVHLGGGPPAFRRLLHRQVELRSMLPVAPTADPEWVVVEEGFNLSREHEIESLFTVANGYLGTRGSLAEGSELSAPATFVAGVYDIPAKPGSVPELARAPDWMRLRASVDGHVLRLQGTQPLAHRRILDLRQGILWREWRHEGPAGRISRVLGARLASLAERHLLVQAVVLVPENYSGRIQLETWIETEPAWPGALGGVPALLAPVRWDAPSSPPPGRISLLLRAAGTGTEVAFASAACLHVPAGGCVEREVVTGGEELVERWAGEVDLGIGRRLDRLVAVYTSRDRDDPAAAAQRCLDAVLARGVDAAIAEHVAAWARRWHTARIDVEGNADDARALHFATYHMIAAANPEDERVSIGARGLTGEAYKGHVFWDTEMYVHPFFTLTHPPTARALLMYRYHTLGAARERAARLGYRGALFAWESADTGEETAPAFALAPDGTVIRIRSGELEHHIDAAIAHAAWEYWRTTGDDDFLVGAGAEILLEIARFWASRGGWEADGLYHIRHVIGPDEYHEDVDDNAYTNVMAAWCLERGARVARILGRRWPDRWRELSRALGVTPAEVEEWRRIAGAVYTGYDPRTGLFEQFQGYFGLEEIDIAAYEPREAPMDVLLGRERTQRSKVIKQADVVLLIHLLWNRIRPHVREANFRYYEPRCGHGSSLSPGIHAVVAARLGDIGTAERYFRQTAAIDLADNMGNAAGGVHIGALGSLWQAAIFGFAGLRRVGRWPVFDPHLPNGWNALRFRILWRGRTLRITMGRAPRSVAIELEEGDPMVVGVVGVPRIRLHPGTIMGIEESDGRWGQWSESSGATPNESAEVAP